VCKKTKLTPSAVATHLSDLTIQDKNQEYIR